VWMAQEPRNVAAKREAGYPGIRLPNDDLGHIGTSLAGSPTLLRG
jgi:hypothetical protein